MSFATATILGNLGKDPVTRATGSDNVTSFSVAVTRTTKVGGEKREATTWWNVSVWGMRGQIAGKYLRKGSSVICSGTPVLREYDDQNGAKRHSLDLVNADWGFAGGKRDEAPASATSTAAPSAAGTAPSTATAAPSVGATVGADEPPF